MSEAMGIQAAIRQHIQRNQHGGNLLKAEARNGHVDQPHVAVTFTGTRSDDKRTEFYQDTYEGYGAGTYTLRCELANGKWYYLCAEDDKVFLVKKSVSEAPKDKKFMFQTSKYPVSDGGHFWTIKSLGTGMFLASDDEGNVSLIDRPTDLYTWLKFVHSLETEMESFVEEDTVFSFHYDSIHFTASYCQTSEVEAC